MHAHPTHSNFRKFFVRGLGILLPSVLTIWILIAAYGFVQTRIADPINRGVRWSIVTITPWPEALEGEMQEVRQSLSATEVQQMQAAGNPHLWLREHSRARKLEYWWRQYAFPLDFIGLVIAVLLIYAVGLVVGSFIGRRLYHRGEQLVQGLPIIKMIYPSVKQVTDFFVGDSTARLQFNRVVAVEYPRKGVWSLGLVTGQPMRTVQEHAGRPCLMIFVPSSPTPFTGYVVTVPAEDTIDLPITIEEALRLIMSGGVVVPESQRINPPSSSGSAGPSAPVSVAAQEIGV